MRARDFGVFAALIAIGACACERVDLPRWRSLGEGLHYTQVSAQGAARQAEITAHVLRFDPRRWRTIVVGPETIGEAVNDAGVFRRAVDGVAAINGGYFDPQLRPLGLLISEGKQRSRLRKVDHGVLTIDRDGGVQLQHAQTFSQPANVDFAIECGPRLVVDGRTLTFKPGIARRTALGFDRTGRVHWAVTENVVSVADLAAFLQRPAGNGGLGLHQALNLDGGSSTMLDIEAPQTKVSVRSSVRVPVGLALVPRGRR